MSITQIKLRRDTSANWTLRNPILSAGEPGLETDTLIVKYGDGITTWANLSYPAVAVGIQGNVGPQGNAGLQGDAGPPGTNGVDGTSITSVAVTAGNLIVTLSDSTTIDAGNVVGPAGADGAPGLPGSGGGTAVAVPASALGQAGDTVGMWAADYSFYYFCYVDYSGNSAAIWRRIPFDSNNFW